jgi:hypothetical protein
MALKRAMPNEGMGFTNGHFLLLFTLEAMAQPTVIADLTSSAVNNALSENNSTTSSAPAKPTNGTSSLAGLDPSKLKVTVIQAGGFRFGLGYFGGGQRVDF